MNGLERKDFYRLALVTALVSLIFGLPHILISLKLDSEGKDYTPLVANYELWNGASTLTNEESMGYAPRVREVLDGHWMVSDAHALEYKGSVYYMPYLLELFLGVATFFTGSLQTTFILADFLFPPMIFLAIFLFLYEVTGDKCLSFFGGVSTILASPVVGYAIRFDFRDAIRFLTLNIVELLAFSRLVNPQLSFVLLMSALFLLYLGLARRNAAYSVGGGVFTGLCFYAYFYYWSFILAGMGVFIVLSLMRGEKQELKLSLASMVTAAVVSIPYWLNYVRFNSSPYAKEILLRTGVEYGRTVTVLTVPYLVFIVMYYLMFKGKNTSFYFLLSFLLGGLACRNIQVLTGFTVQSEHWSQRVFDPWIMISSAALLADLKRNRLGASGRKLLSYACTCLAVLLLVFGFSLQKKFSDEKHGYYFMDEDVMDSFRWLNENTRVDSVVLTDYETASMVPTYTHNNIFTPFSPHTLAPTEDLLDRMIIAYKVFNVSPEYFSGFIGSRKAYWNIYHAENLTYITPLSALFDVEAAKGRRGSYPTISEGMQERLNRRFTEYVFDADEVREMYALDYVYLGPNEKNISNADLDSAGWLRKVYENNKVSIYEAL